MLPLNNRPLVYPITTGKATDNNFPESKKRILNLLTAAVKAKIPLFQIREKQLSARLLFDLAQSAAQITRSTDTKLLVNDRADIALAAGADGVHLTANSLAASVVRQNFGEDFIVGVSAHSLAAVLQAENDRADFATFSPVFSTPNKGEPQGLEKLREACSAAQGFPIVALGGIDETNYKSVLAVGARGFAAIRWFNDVERLSGFAAEERQFKISR